MDIEAGLHWLSAIAAVQNYVHGVGNLAEWAVACMHPKDRAAALHTYSNPKFTACIEQNFKSPG